MNQLQRFDALAHGRLSTHDAKIAALEGALAELRLVVCVIGFSVLAVCAVFFAATY